MKTLVLSFALGIVALAGLPGHAQAVVTDAPAYGPVAGSDVVLEDLKFVARPVVVFADSPSDPNVERQVRMLLERPEALLERDIVVIVDTDPEARSAVRLKLRPRGFSLVILDRDGEVKLRKPAPWSVREIIAAIDKFPSRREEMLEQRPSGR
jgi:hypothetical protein